MPKFNLITFKKIFRNNELFSISISWILFMGNRKHHLPFEVYEYFQRFEVLRINGNALNRNKRFRFHVNSELQVPS